MVSIENKWYWGTTVYLVTEDGCGLLKCTIDDEKKEDCGIFDLNVHPSRQRQGYATRLMQAAEQEARRHGCKRLFLFANKDSWVQEWYQRLGFGIIPFAKPPHDSVVWMDKFL